MGEEGKICWWLHNSISMEPSSKRLKEDPSEDRQCRPIEPLSASVDVVDELSNGVVDLSLGDFAEAMAAKDVLSTQAYLDSLSVVRRVGLAEQAEQRSKLAQERDARASKKSKF